MAPNLFREISADIFISGTALGNEAKRLGTGGHELRVGDPFILAHFAQHPVATGNGKLCVLCATITFWRLGQDGKECHFMQLKLVHAFREIGLRCGFHAERLPTERNFIKV